MDKPVISRQNPLVIVEKKVKKLRNNTQTWHKWNEDEMKLVFTALDNGSNARDLSKYPPLRTRHSKNAIYQMASRIVNRNINKKYLSKFAFDMIREYYESKGNHVPFTIG